MVITREHALKAINVALQQLKPINPEYQDTVDANKLLHLAINNFARRNYEWAASDARISLLCSVGFDHPDYDMIVEEYDRLWCSNDGPTLEFRVGPPLEFSVAPGTFDLDTDDEDISPNIQLGDN
jgi:hypothetical protein